MGVDLPAQRRRIGAALGVDRDDDALRAETRARINDQLRILHRRRIDADLVGTGVEQPADILDAAHAAAHRQRNEHLRRDILDDLEDQSAAIGARRDVQEGQLVGALEIVAARVTALTYRVLL